MVRCVVAVGVVVIMTTGESGCGCNGGWDGWDGLDAWDGWDGGGGDCDVGAAAREVEVALALVEVFELTSCMASRRRLLLFGFRRGRPLGPTGGVLLLDAISEVGAIIW